MCTASPTTKDVSAHQMDFPLSVEDPKSFFQYQRNHWLSEAQSGSNTNLNFVCKSGELVAGHQAAILPRSSHLKLLVESSKSCGCAEDVPTLILPDWDVKIIQDMLHLLYSGSVSVANKSMEELRKLMDELGFNISRDQLLTEPELTFGKRLIEEVSVDEKQLILGWNQRIVVKQVETKKRNKEQERVKNKLKEVVDFLESVEIKTEESLVAISKPLEELVSSLKYLPTEPSFDSLPPEIKTKILNYLCNSGAFVSASVSRDWKEILQKRLVKKEIKVGKHCSNSHACENDNCFMPEEILKASATVKLDVRLKICYPVTNVEAKLLAEALTSASELRITKYCCCSDYSQVPRFGLTSTKYSKEIITQKQMKQFIETFEQKNDLLKSIDLSHLNTTNMDQDNLMNSLLKVDRLFLGYGSDFKGEALIDKLLENAPKLTVTQPIPKSYHNRSPKDLANALCQVESLYLGEMFPEDGTIKQIISNVLTLPIRMENLFMFKMCFWFQLISPEDLQGLMIKLKKFALYGFFLKEQVDVARIIPGVNVVRIDKENGSYDETRILMHKGINIDKSSRIYKSSKLTSFYFSDLYS